MSISDTSLAQQRMQRFQQFLAEDPGNQALRLDLFTQALAAGEHTVAQEQVGAGLQADPDSVDWRYRQALLALAQQDFPGAEAVLALLVAEGNSIPPLLYQLAYAQFCQGKNSQAMAIAQHLVAHALSEQPQALPLLMRCLQRDGHLTQALAVFREYLEKYSATLLTADAWGLASVMALDAESMLEAEAWAVQALALQPYQLEAMITQGTLALGRQDTAVAKQVLGQGVQRYPHSGRCWSALGLTYLLTQELQEAALALEQATRIMPSHIGTWNGLGWCYIARHELLAASVAFEKALKLDRNFADSHGSLAVVLVLRGQLARAKEHIQNAFWLDRRCASALYAQALIRGEGRDLASVRKMAERLLGQRKTVNGESMAEIVLRKIQ